MSVFDFILQPAFVAVHCQEGVSIDSLAMAASRVCSFYAAKDIRCSCSIASTTALISFEPYPSDYRAPLTHLDENNHVVSTNYLPTEIVFDVSDAARDSRYLLPFAKKFGGHEPDAAYVPPPFAYARHRVDIENLLVANDGFGSGKLYRYRDSNIYIVGTRLGAVLAALNRVPSVNRSTVDSYATFDWIVDDDCFVDDVVLLPPGTQVRSHSGELPVEVQRHAVSATWLREACSDRDTLDSAIDVGARVISAASQLSEDAVLNVGLTGGRDSRAIASMIEATAEAYAGRLDVGARYHTFSPPKLEVEIARELVSSSSSPMPWSDQPHPTVEMTGACANLVEQGKYWFKRHDGDCWPSFVRNKIPDSQSVPKSLTLTGWGGEIVRSHFYSNADIDPRQAIGTLLRRRRTANPLINERAKGVAVSKMASILLDGYEAGYDGLHLLDHFYVRSQQRRRVPSSFRMDAFSPLYTPQMYLAGFSAPPGEKLAGGVAQRVVERCKPEWSSIDYFSSRAANIALDLTNKTKVLRFYWEEDRPALLTQLEQALSEYDVFARDTIDRYAQIERGDRNDATFQNTANRIFWLHGLRAFVADLQRVMQADLAPRTFDRVLVRGPEAAEVKSRPGMLERLFGRT